MEGQEGGGLGLGEGEGKKDVSDRIESEDQLEDARPAGEEEEEKEDPECEVSKEIIKKELNDGTTGPSIHTYTK